MAFVDSWLSHLRVLSVEIGPRGSTTPAERKAAEYCYQVFEKLGLSPRIESFTSARSIFLPHVLASAGMLAAFIIYPLAGRWTAAIAAILSLVALASDLLELSFRDNLIRRLVPKGPSQNVVAVIPPAAEHRQDLILIGHLDSQRTPLIFKTPGWLAAYKSFTTIAFIAFIAQTLLYFLGWLTQWPWIWPLSSVGAVCAVLLAAMCIQADSTPFTHGANDNASAASLLLALAEAVKAEPLHHTRLWLACTGCEEVAHYGAIDLFRRHRHEFVNPKAVAFEMLSAGGPAWLTNEGIIIPFRASPELVSLARALAEQHPEWQAHPTQLNGGNTEMADALQAGIPAIALTGMDARGDAPFWHQVEDTFENVDRESLARNHAFIWAFIQALDKQKPQG